MRASVQGSQLEMTVNGHDKFYRLLVVHLDPAGSSRHLLVVNWGRRGARGQFKVVPAPDARSARSLASTQSWSKERKGYRVVVPSLSFDVDLDPGPLVRPRPSDPPARLAEAFESALAQVWEPRLEVLARVVPLAAPVHVLLVSGFSAQVRTQGWAQGVEALLSPFPSARAKQGDLVALGVPAPVGSWLRSNWEPRGSVSVLGPAEVSSSILETFLGLYSPSGTGAMSDPREALSAALLLSPVD